MHRVVFGAPTREAVYYIATNMRREDVAEVWASNEFTPFEAINASIDASKFSTVVWINGVPCAIFGLVIRDLISGNGIPWLLGADKVLDHKREILKHSRPGVEQMLNLCPRLSNRVHADNKVSIRWLKWLGFTIDESEPTGKHGELFHPFHRERV